MGCGSNRGAGWWGDYCCRLNRLPDPVGGYYAVPGVHTGFKYQDWRLAGPAALLVQGKID